MSRRIVDCPECATKSTVIAPTSAPIQCCPFCGNTLLPADRDEDEEDEDEERDDVS
jgi:hypothetical protein